MSGNSYVSILVELVMEFNLDLLLGSCFLFSLFSLTFCASVCLHIRKRCHLCHASWIGLLQNTLTNQSIHIFYRLLKPSFQSKLPSLLLVTPRYLENVIFHQHCETVPWTAPRKIEMWMFGSTLSLLWEKVGAGAFLLIIQCCGEGWDYDEKMSLIFLLVSMWLIRQ